MIITNRVTGTKVNKSPGRLWFEKIMAILALINLMLVFFDLSYVPLRDFWLQGRVQLFLKLGVLEYKIPPTPLKVLPINITPGYDLVKGIEPHRFTSDYLRTVAELNRAIATGGKIEPILAELRDKSTEMVLDNPFQIANKTGTLERIKRKMRLHIFDNKNASATQAFNIFWSSGNLSENYREELDFFAREIEPLIATNYFRPVGVNGKPVDYFGLLDFPFFVIFGLEFLARTWYISRRYTGISWFDAMLWRWYDVFFLIPVFRWLRVIPVVIRLSQAELIDLSRVRKQVSQGVVANIAQDVTEVVVIQLINQLQSSITRGELTNFLIESNQRQYIDLNDIDEVREIIKLIFDLVVKDVLPKLQDDFEQLLNHSINRGLNESSAFQALQQLPGGNQISSNVSQQIAKQVYQSLYRSLEIVVEEDPVFDELLKNIINKFRMVMRSEIQAQNSMKNLEYLLSALLEEIKVNYVVRLSRTNIEDILEQQRVLLKTAKEN
ncbi:hypothetical protein [Gloeocapsa sp. PCC 73106]|uniref:hypothetical protein n=1 Tax=Gloeocapsa sp. PCC 73106 TaxID=102232 RepID=UPI0002AD0CD3|nr:hypothetical protein [Gloeocapsa sp. PCC 73106]ELR97749.1 hypothetical protein GLO73106DRAFT_00015630 [Gloeocapsa sp. PCC 73106]